MERVIEGLAFAEGMRWRDGQLWFSDMHDGTVHRWSRDSGDEVVLSIDDAPSGLGWSPAGELLVVGMDRRQLLRATADGGVIVVAELGEHSAHPINDMVLDDRGAAYIGTFGFDLHGGGDLAPGAIVRVDADGSHRLAARDLLFPNGMAIVDHGATLVVAETLASRLSAFRIGSDGSLSQRRVWAQLPEGVWPDGICADPSGAIWAASTTTGEVLAVREGGEVVARVATTGQMGIDCLVGDDGATLYVASSDHLSPADAAQQRSSRIDATANPLRS